MTDMRLTDLTIKQQKFVTGYLEGKPMVRAATEAGYAPSTAARGAAAEATWLARSPEVMSTTSAAVQSTGGALVAVMASTCRSRIWRAMSLMTFRPFSRALGPKEILPSVIALKP